MTKNKKGFIIYDFMVDKLCLTGVPLLVFALIYSFTAAESNCYGSIDYMANRVGASSSAVKRALKLLIDRELIIKNSDKNYRTKIYIVNLVTLMGVDEKSSQIDPPGTDMVTESELTYAGFNLDYNNKEIINTTKTTTTEHRRENDPYFYTFGCEQLVLLTINQYDDLNKRLGEDTANHYIARLDGYIFTHRNVFVKNHYKTILKWAREDAELED